MIKILTLLHRYLPGYKSGGPVRSVEQLVEQLGQEMDFSVLTTDRDNGDSIPYSDVQPNVWVNTGDCSVKHVSPKGAGHLALSRAIRARAHDVLYLNSLFSRRFSISPMIARHLGQIPYNRVIIAPRGELSPGALALKATKKTAFLKFARASGVWRDVTWQASTENEAEHIRTFMGRQANDIRVACDLSSPVTNERAAYTPRATGEPLRVLFISRLAPKKNLDYALEVLNGVKARVKLTIVGPEEDIKYVSRCRRLAAALPENIEVTWVGAVRHECLPKIHAAHDLMFLPTLGENFGHVIVESFSAGLPVLLSNTTPWRNLSERQIGYDFPLDDMHAFRSAIRLKPPVRLVKRWPSDPWSLLLQMRAKQTVGIWTPTENFSDLSAGTREPAKACWVQHHSGSTIDPLHPNVLPLGFACTPTKEKTVEGVVVPFPPTLPAAHLKDRYPPTSAIVSMDQMSIMH